MSLRSKHTSRLDTHRSKTAVSRDARERATRLVAKSLDPAASSSSIEKSPELLQHSFATPHQHYVPHCHTKYALARLRHTKRQCRRHRHVQPSSQPSHESARPQLFPKDDSHIGRAHIRQQDDVKMQSRTDRKPRDSALHPRVQHQTRPRQRAGVERRKMHGAAAGGCPQRCVRHYMQHLPVLSLNSRQIAPHGALSYATSSRPAP